MIDELVNKAELSRLLGTGDKITNKRIPKKHKVKIQELNDLIEYWKKRNNIE